MFPPEGPKAATMSAAAPSLILLSLHTAGRGVGRADKGDLHSQKSKSSRQAQPQRVNDAGRYEEVEKGVGRD